jgi:hypothetical protein
MIGSSMGTCSVVVEGRRGERLRVYPPKELTLHFPSSQEVILASWEFSTTRSPPCPGRAVTVRWTCP